MPSTPLHPSADSDIEHAQARVNAEQLLRSVAGTEVDTRLLNACRKMPIGQLAYVLINLDKRTEHFPPRDYAVAKAFIELYDAIPRH